MPVEVVIDQRGGTVVGPDNVELGVLPGALSRPTQIRINGLDAVENILAASRAYEIEPTELRGDRPFEVRILLKGLGREVTMFHTDRPDGTWRELPSSVSDVLVVGETDRLGIFVLARP